MVSASRFGDCLLTVATGELKELNGEEEQAVGLVSTHAYAVLQVREVLGVRLLQLKNPWSYLRWKGAYSAGDTKRWTKPTGLEPLSARSAHLLLCQRAAAAAAAAADGRQLARSCDLRWTPELRKALNYDQSTAAQHDNGVFWIDYASLLSYYQGVYLNWNPQLFAHHTTHHGQWPPKTSRVGAGGEVLPDEANLGRNPQYALSVNVPSGGSSGGKPAAVWILLTRHTTRKDQGKEDFLTVHVFQKRGGYRVYHLEHCWRMGIYSNRPHCLVQFDLPPGAHKLTLALAQYTLVPHQVDYTLKVRAAAMAVAEQRCSSIAALPSLHHPTLTTHFNPSSPTHFNPSSPPHPHHPILAPFSPPHFHPRLDTSFAGLLDGLLHPAQAAVHHARGQAASRRVARRLSRRVHELRYGGRQPDLCAAAGQCCNGSLCRAERAGQVSGWD